MGTLFRQRRTIFYILVAIISLVFLFVDFTSTIPTSSPSSQPTQHYLKATVEKITKEGTVDLNGTKNLIQEITVSYSEDGQQKEASLTHGGSKIVTSPQKLRVGQHIILAKTTTRDGASQFVVWDQYRLPQVGVIIGIFFILVFVITGRRGWGSLFGLLFSFLVIIKGIVPLIMQGQDPLTVSIIGSLIILSVGIYLAHGLSEQTTVAVTSTFLSLVLTGVLAVFFVKLANLSGLGSEDIYTLQLRFTETINFQGLLLGGIIIGALGVLDDVTTAQAATVYELAKTDPRLTFVALAKKGMNVGREHIASLVNTLVLAYAGASIGIFIYVLLGLQNGSTPLWVILNSEMLMEEVIRTLAGSIGLIMAVPITTVIAAFLSKYSVKLT